jgi:tRNA modification GTPase
VKSDLFLKNKVAVKNTISKIAKILVNYNNLQILKHGLNVTIIGKPNVGKSTLLNALSRKQVAIVSEEPGTTRDILQTQIECGGVLVNLYDTAGLRSSTNKIENEGMKRAKYLN